jgi:hypothetical protein
MENRGLFYDHLVYFTDIGNILWPFGIFYGHLVYFSPFWYFVPWKIWQPFLSRNYAKILHVAAVTWTMERLVAKVLP